MEGPFLDQQQKMMNKQTITFANDHGDYYATGCLLDYP